MANILFFFFFWVVFILFFNVFLGQVCLNNYKVIQFYLIYFWTNLVFTINIVIKYPHFFSKPTCTLVEQKKNVTTYIYLFILQFDSQSIYYHMIWWMNWKVDNFLNWIPKVDKKKTFNTLLMYQKNILPN